MKIEEILQLVDSVSRSTLAEFKYEEGGVKLSLKKAVAASAAVQPGVQIPMPLVEQPSVQTTVPVPVSVSVDRTADSGAPDGKETAQKEAEGGKIVKSPLVGTFYAAPTEDAKPFVKVGDSVKEGQVLAIVEAMKLMNDIESDFTGTVAEILVQNGDAVEYGQPLFVIK